MGCLGRGARSGEGLAGLGCSCPGGDLGEGTLAAPMERSEGCPCPCGGGGEGKNGMLAVGGPEGGGA